MNAVLYDAEKTKELEAAFEVDLEGCIAFDLKEYRSRPGWMRFRDSLARLLSPLM
jgi:cardiolipin synthase